MQISAPPDRPAIVTHPPVEYRVTIDRSPAAVIAAQRLRHRVFADEYSAITPGPVGLDADLFDSHCDHLVVWHRTEGVEPDRPEWEAVATYRLLPPSNRLGRLYSAGEFDLGPLRPLLPFTVESGRSCVHPGHRNGATMALMWSAIARYMLQGGYRYLIGCASVPLTDGGELAAGVWQHLRQKSMDPVLRCRPHRPWRSGVVPPAIVRFPPLLKGYLRLGATVLAPPAHDPHFNCADFLLLVDLQTADPRYLRRFLAMDPNAVIDTSGTDTTVPALHLVRECNQ